MTDRDLMQKAFEARRRAYAPYSRFAVGAALLCAGGRVFIGCNIENAAHSPGLCAERAAVAAAVMAGGGRQYLEFISIAVAGGPEDGGSSGFCFPCGVCRQVLREFCRPDFRILLAKGSPDAFETAEYTLEELLPHGFGPENLT